MQRCNQGRIIKANEGRVKARDCRVWLLACFLWPCLLLPVRASVVIQESPYCVVGGEDGESVAWVVRLVNEVAVVLQRELLAPRLFEGQISIKLMEEGPKERSYDILGLGRGSVQLRLYWQEDLPREACYLAVMDAMLRRHAYWQWRVEVEEVPPPWLLHALLGELMVHLRPQWWDAYSLAWRQDSYLSVEAIWQGDQGEMSEQQRRYVYHLFFKQCKKAFPLGVDRKVWLSGALQGKSLDQCLDALSGQPWQDLVQVELWWAVAFAEWIQVYQSPIYGLQRSRELWLRLSAFPLRSAQRLHDYQVEELWLYRHHPDMVALLEKRLVEVRWQLGYMNPVFYNTLLSMGQVFEAVLSEDVEAYREALALYLKDSEEAESVYGELLRLLSMS